MLEIRRILAAVDLGEQTPLVLRHAAEVARRFSSELVVCHVVETHDLLAGLPPVGESYFPPDWPDQAVAAAKEKGAEILVQSGAPEARLEIRTGSPFVEIVRLAREIEAELVVLGTHGRGPVAHLLLGSVAERVVRKCPCPVLTVRSGAHAFVLP